MLRSAMETLQLHADRARFQRRTRGSVSDFSFFSMLLILKRIIRKEYVGIEISKRSVTGGSAPPETALALH